MTHRKNAGLIISSIGVIAYLIHSIVIYWFTWGMGILPLTTLLTGVISLLGIIIGVDRIKLGGLVMLISIPLSIVSILILNSFLEYHSIYLIIIYPFALFPIPSFMFIGIGGIMCLTYSDN